MKIIAIPLLLVSIIAISFAGAPVHLWGLTTKDNRNNYQAGIYVQAESPQGNSPIVQSYWISGGKAQYHIDGDDLEKGRTYTRVHGWTDDAEGEAPGFTWTGDANVRRDVMVISTSK
jgi:hypothetical protein